jgi:hypothetical protein
LVWIFLTGYSSTEPVSASPNKKVLTKLLSKINADCSKNKQYVYTLLKDSARPNFSTTSTGGYSR